MVLTSIFFKSLWDSFQVFLSLYSLQEPEGASSMRSQPGVCSMTTCGNPPPCFLTSTLHERGFISAKAGFPSYPSLPRTGHVQGSIALCRPGSQGLPGQNWDKHNKDLLFISYKMASKETFTQLALYLAQEADPLCTSDSRGGGAAPLNARTHELCSLAASVAFRGSVDTEVILSACLDTPPSQISIFRPLPF